jgi:hypothetical protein
MAPEAGKMGKSLFGLVHINKPNIFLWIYNSDEQASNQNFAESRRSGFEEFYG